MLFLAALTAISFALAAPWAWLSVVVSRARRLGVDSRAVRVAVRFQTVIGTVMGVTLALWSSGAFAAFFLTAPTGSARAVLNGIVPILGSLFMLELLIEVVASCVLALLVSASLKRSRTLADQG